jgi:hypothetical protein
MKSQIMSPVGHQTNETSPLLTRSILKEIPNIDVLHMVAA